MTLAIIVPITVFVVIIVGSMILGGIGCDVAAEARKK